MTSYHFIDMSLFLWLQPDLALFLLYLNSLSEKINGHLWKYVATYETSSRILWNALLRNIYHRLVCYFWNTKMYSLDRMFPIRSYIVSAWNYLCEFPVTCKTYSGANKQREHTQTNSWTVNRFKRWVDYQREILSVVTWAK